MRVTNRLLAQHIGWTFKKHWQVQGVRNPQNDVSLKDLEKNGIQIKYPKDVLDSKVSHNPIEIEAFRKEITTDPAKWQKSVCHSYSDNQVLLEGIPQAQHLTNTIEVNGLPEGIQTAINKLQLSNAFDRRIQSLVMQSNVFDSEQVKLPKLKLEERPAYNLPRLFGISQERRNSLLVNKLIAECEQLTDPAVAAQRRLIDNAVFKSTFTKGSEVLQFTLTANKFITTVRPLLSMKGKFESTMPDLHPVNSTITLPKTHFYTEETLYPFSTSVRCAHPHTVFIQSKYDVFGNILGLEVSPTQLYSRSLMVAFTAAFARAKQLHGVDAKQLPAPIVVQSIQSDGRTFHFGVFQLNTLDLDTNNLLKNYWFHIPNINIFSKCGYKNGRPFLDGYNKDVFRILYAFYNNI